MARAIFMQIPVAAVSLEIHVGWWDKWNFKYWAIPGVTLLMVAHLRARCQWGKAGIHRAHETTCRMKKWFPEQQTLLFHLRTFTYHPVSSHPFPFYPPTLLRHSLVSTWRLPNVVNVLQGSESCCPCMCPSRGVWMGGSRPLSLGRPPIKGTPYPHQVVRIFIQSWEFFLEGKDLSWVHQSRDERVMGWSLRRKVREAASWVWEALWVTPGFKFHPSYHGLYSPVYSMSTVNQSQRKWKN